jgi:hypothetical protein
MMRCALLLSCLLMFFLGGFAAADPGMWLFEAFPAAKVKAKYGFDPTPQFLNNVRLSSVRFNNGGSGSFVSADGLTFTNHHIASECIQQLSTAGKDYMKTGFYARSQAEELKCPAYELNQLVGIEDVTAQVKGAAKAGMAAAEAGQAQRAEMSRIEEQCTKKTGLRCDVVTLYSGEVYHLYQYKKYTDVRLVFAPEFDIAFFGGDPDNFEYPRYDLDISFFRVYENGKPVHLDNYFRWSAGGVQDHELIFVSGNPGATGRLLTMAQLQFLRDVDYPSRLELYRRRISMLEKFSAESADNARIAQEDLFSYQNSLKAITGYLSGLEDKQLLAQKTADEQKLKDFVSSDAKLKAELGDPWAALAQSMQVQKQIYLPLTYVERMRGFSGDLAMYARDLVRGAQQRMKPSPDRLREFRESALPSLEARLFSTAPVYKNLQAAELTDSIGLMEQKLGHDNPVVRVTLNGKTAEAAAHYLIENTKLQDVAVRKELWNGGEAAIQASTDPLIVLMRQIEPEALAVRKQYEDQVESVARRDGALLAKARFAMGGLSEPPDATFTLRLSYGEVEGYTTGGKQYPYYTTMGGAYQHAAAHGDKPPYQLPESWMTKKPQVKLATPLNFVNTADSIGGNSGSPMVDSKGEVVGILFDGNIESLPWNFEYSDKVGRSISVDSRGIMEALRDIYGASRVVQELESGRKENGK